MNISDLLNPEPPYTIRHPRVAQAREWRSPPVADVLVPALFSSQPLTHPSPTRLNPRQFRALQRTPKIRKDEPVFRRAPTVGSVRYPPYEAGTDEELSRQYKAWSIFPGENIRGYCNTIPYRTQKRTFLEKTGRTAFEVFQYQFTYPGDTKEWLIMWDYNTGLVKTTPFFKCQGYAKTQPNRVQKMNDGITEIMHNITGGAITAQGYWMPFAAARALATTFCYNIRYALVPLFGPSFPSDCLPLTDPSYGKFNVSQEVIKACIVEQQKWLTNADDPSKAGPSQGAVHSRCEVSPALKMEHPLTPETPKPWHGRKLLARSVFKDPDWTPSPEPVSATEFTSDCASSSSVSSPLISPKTIKGIPVPLMKAAKPLTLPRLPALDNMIPATQPFHSSHTYQPSCRSKQGPIDPTTNPGHSPSTNRSSRELQAAQDLLYFRTSPSRSPKKRMHDDIESDVDVGSNEFGRIKQEDSKGSHGVFAGSSKRRRVGRVDY